MRYLQINKLGNFDLENEDHGVEEHDLLHSNGNVQFYTGDCVQNNKLHGHILLCKSRHTQRETEMLTIGKISKADLPKNIATEISPTILSISLLISSFSLASLLLDLNSL